MSIRVVIAKIDAVAVKRSDLPETSFAGTATVAAGGKSSAVHKASVRAYVTPSNYTGKVDLTFTASLSGAAAFTGTSVNGRLDIGDGSVVGDNSATIHVTHVTNGHFDGILTSSNVKRNCTVTIAGKTAQVTFEWDCAGSKDFDYDEFFFPGLEFEAVFYPTLDEIATEDEDEDGIIGEGAIDSHMMDFDIMKIKYDYWIYDYEAEEYVDEGEVVEIDIPLNSNPVIRFDVTLDDLFEFDDVVEQPGGKYLGTMIVRDYIEDTGTVVKCICIMGYTLDVFDMEVFEE